MYQIPLLVIVLHILIQNVEAVDPLVDTRIGLIRGLKSNDGTYSMFLGIPYAIVNETNPFGPSTPHPGFDEIFEAYDDSAICPQPYKSDTSIDCLHLNLYIPNQATSNNRLPVLVWIHGGAYIMGSTERDLFGPSFLVRHDIIVVAINYRLGPYGFMCLDNPKVPGNQGLKDQLLALKWIKSNIEAFGGDANSITISGESAGGASVDFHLYYYLEEKLFNKAIMQSGNALTAPEIVREPDTEAPIKLSKFLGFETDDENDALSFLSTVDTNLVVAATQDLGLILNVPCVEKEFDGVDAFIKNHPVNTLLPNIKNIPILIGYNNRECKEEYYNIMLQDNLIRYYLDDYFNFEKSELDEMEELVKHYYIGDQIVSENTESQMIDFMSDFKFNYGTVRSILKYLENGAEKVYHYVFSYEGERSLEMKSGGQANVNQSGAAHADDLFYLFESTYMKDEPSSEDKTVIDRMTTLWSNFVKYGDPTPETSDLLPVFWSTVSQDKLYYLDIDKEISVKQRAFHSRIAFWELFYKLNKKYEQGYQNDGEQNK